MAIVWNAQRETLRFINPTRVTKGLRRAARLGVVLGVTTNGRGAPDCHHAW
jgi:hypothetical protein